MSPISVLGQASNKSSLLFCLRSLAGVIKCDTNSLILSRFVCYSYRNISIVVVVYLTSVDGYMPDGDRANKLAKNQEKLQQGPAKKNKI